MKTIKPRIASLLTRQVARPVKRINGSSLYKLMSDFAVNHPRLCIKCKESGFIRFGDELDHIKPISEGGTNNFANLQWLCRSCHHEKTIKEAEERGRGWFES